MDSWISSGRMVENEDRLEVLLCIYIPFERFGLDSIPSMFCRSSKSSRGDPLEVNIFLGYLECVKIFMHNSTKRRGISLFSWML
jgi:hypothetical protein